MQRQAGRLEELDEDGDAVVVAGLVACRMLLSAAHAHLTRTERRQALYALSQTNLNIRSTGDVQPKTNPNPSPSP